MPPGMRSTGRPPYARRTRDDHLRETVKISRRNVLKNNWWMLLLICRSTPGYVVFMILDGLLGGIIGAVDLLYTKSLLEGLDNRAPFGYVAALIGIYVAFQLLINAFTGWYRQRYVPYVSEKLNVEMNAGLFEKAVGLDLSLYDDPEFYNDFIWAINQSGSRAVLLIDDTGRLIQRVVSSVALIGVMLTVDLWLAIIATGMAVIGALLMMLRNKINLAYLDELNPVRRKDEYINRIYKLPDYAKELRLSHIGEAMFRELDDNTRRKKKLADRYFPRRTAIGMAIDMTRNCGNILLLMLVLYRVMVVGDMSVGGFAVAVNAVWRMSFFLRDLTMRLSAYHEHGLFIEKIRRFVDYRRTILDGALEAPPLEELSIRDVRFSYFDREERVDALSGVTLHIRRGEKIAIVGYNGAGKTTLTKLIMRLYDPAAGEILYNGRPLSDYTIDSLRQRMAAVFQDYRLFAATVAENVVGGVYSPAQEGAMLAALEKATFTEKLRSLPHGTDTPLTREFDRDGTQLSGGEAQKVVLARAFFKNADLLILDEPSSALDPDAEYALNRSIADYADGRAVIFISHRLSTTRHADRIYMFDSGRLVEAGTHEELIARGGQYAYMFNLQAEQYRRGAKIEEGKKHREHYRTVDEEARRPADRKTDRADRGDGWSWQ